MKQPDGMLGRASMKLQQSKLTLAAQAGVEWSAALQQKLENPNIGATVVPTVSRGYERLLESIIGTEIDRGFGMTKISLQEAVALVEGTRQGLYEFNGWTQRQQLRTEQLVQVIPWLLTSKLLYARSYDEWGLLAPPLPLRHAWDDSVINENSPLWQIAYAYFAMYIIRPSQSCAVHKFCATWKQQLKLYHDSVTHVQVLHNHSIINPQQHTTASGVARTYLLRGATLDGGFEDALQLVITIDKPQSPYVTFEPLMTNLEDWFQRAQRFNPRLVEYMTRLDRYPQGLFVFVGLPDFDVPLESRANYIPVAAFSVRRRLLSLAGQEAFDVQHYTPDQLEQQLGVLAKIDVLNLPPNVLMVSWNLPENVYRESVNLGIASNQIQSNEQPQKIIEIMTRLSALASSPPADVRVFQSYDMYVTGTFPKVVVHTNLVPVIPSMPAGLIGPQDSWKTQYNALAQTLIRRRLFRTVVSTRRHNERPEENSVVYSTEELITNNRLPYLPYAKKYLCVRLVFDVEANGAIMGLNTQFRNAETLRDTSISDGGAGLIARCQQRKCMFEVHLSLSQVNRVFILKADGSGETAVHTDPNRPTSTIYDNSHRLFLAAAPSQRSFTEAGPAAVRDAQAEEDRSRGKRTRTEAPPDSASSSSANDQPSGATLNGEDFASVLDIFGISCGLLGFQVNDVSSLLMGIWNPRKNTAVLLDPDNILHGLGYENVMLMVYAKQPGREPEIRTRQRFHLVRINDDELRYRFELMPLPFDEPLNPLSSVHVASHLAVVPNANGAMLELPVLPNIAAKANGGAVHRHNSTTHSKWVPVHQSHRYLHPYYASSSSDPVTSGTHVLGGTA
jgi:hypothetical protein